MEKNNDYYRDLLIKYMAHIVDIEGIDFVDKTSHLEDPLSLSEILELEKLSREKLNVPLKK